MKSNTDAKIPEPELFSGNWNHLFGPGRAETRCRIVVDVANEEVVAAQAFDGLKWTDLCAAERSDLAASLFEANEIGKAPKDWGLSPIESFPQWASRRGMPAESMAVGLSDQEVVDGAERMARVLLQAWGFEFSGEFVRNSTNPRAVSAWSVVSRMLEEYNGTDLVSAVDAVESDESDESASEPIESPVTAFERKVHETFRAADGLKVVFSSMLQERTRHTAVYHAHSGQQATIVGVGISPEQEQGWDEESLPFLKVRFEDGVEVMAFGEELFSKDERFFALYAAVLRGYGLARELPGSFAGPYHLAREGSDTDRRAYLAALNAMKPITACDQAPWTPMEFRVSGNVPGPTA